MQHSTATLERGAGATLKYEASVGFAEVRARVHLDTAAPQWEPRKPLAANGPPADHLEPGAITQTGVFGMKKGPSAKPGPESRKTAAGYPPLAAALIEFEMVPNIVCNVLPMVVKAPIAATDTSAAIRPYSMAVAPDSSLQKALNSFDMVDLP